MMKNLLKLSVLLLSCFTGTAQITCTPDFTFESSAHNDQEIIFHNTTSITGAVAGVHQYYFHYQWGVPFGNVGASYTSQVGENFHDMHHDYGTTGTWTVTLTVEVREIGTSNVVCTSTISKTLNISSSNKCFADFSYTTPGSGSTTADFTNTSSLTSSVAVTTHYEWDFGDGATSTAVDPSHNYASRGHYSVNLKVYHVENATQDTMLYHSNTKFVSVATIDTCHAAFAATPDVSNYLDIDFSNLSYFETSQPRYNLVEYDWDFGDGSSSTAENPSHTYAQGGNYNVDLTISTIDSLTGDTVCNSSYTSTVNVSASNSPFCDAAYTVDSSNSGNGNLFLVNTSTPASNDPAFTTSYSWDFGDGGTSSQAFPTHSYAASGAYPVCLTITSQNASGDYCVDTYCDTLGLDSVGNLLHKSTGGFTLNVLDPATVVQDEHQVDKLELFPNPAQGRVHVMGLMQEAEWYLYSTNGMLVAKGHLPQSQKSIDLHQIGRGLYVLKLLSGQVESSHKLLVE